ncbi:MAG TPA: MarR family winged helix-turn-helix transcriptional regulator [Jatrophihabitantaceae bacterium]|nr:MarR family winged helix-turn-helix transcriptional regulator [Jatrophihabitantaceae bacterium]
MTNWLTDEEQRAWRAYRRMVLLVDAEVARELNRDSGLSMPDYQVLSALSESADLRCRLSELAINMQWSASRLSHHVSRMEQRGLVRRADCASDARGAFVVVTDHGLDAIRRAAPDHVASVRRHLIDLLTPEQVAALSEIGETVIGHFGENCQKWAAKAAPDCGGDPAAYGQSAPDGAASDQAADAPGQSAKASPDSRSYAST